MRTELAYVAKIKTLTQIKGADRIETATVLGWEVVCKKDDFKVGDLCVYAEVDSIFPENIPCFEFLKPRKMRIRIVKLRGQISQGICFPISILKEVNPDFDLSKIKEGMDCTSLLGLVQHDPETSLDVKRVQIKKSWLDCKLAYLKWKLFGFKPTTSNDFPPEIPKTDETRVQRMGTLLEEKAGTPVYITEKCDGTSSTFVFQRTSGNWLSRFLKKDCLFRVCSRNRVVWSSEDKGYPDHHIAYVAKKYDIFNKMKKLGRNFAIQAECLGQSKNGSNKVQGNLYNLTDYEIRVFSMYDIDQKRYFQQQELWALSKELDLPMVPLLECGVPLVNDIKYYVELSKMKSTLNKNVWCEGKVIRALDSSFSFKSINPEFLLHNELKEKG